MPSWCPSAGYCMQTSVECHACLRRQSGGWKGPNTQLHRISIDYIVIVYIRLYLSLGSPLPDHYGRHTPHWCKVHLFFVCVCLYGWVCALVQESLSKLRARLCSLNSLCTKKSNRILSLWWQCISVQKRILKSHWPAWAISKFSLSSCLAHSPLPYHTHVQTVPIRHSGLIQI